MTTDLHGQWGENMRAQRQLRDRAHGLEGSGIDAMARELGVTPATVSRWENGKLIPRDTKKIEIARYLGVDPRMLFPLVDVPS